MSIHARTTARSGLRLRASPHDGEVLDLLPHESAVEILERTVWVRVRTADGREGWVGGDWLEPAEPEDVGPVEVVDYAPPGARDLLIGEPVRIARTFVPAMDEIVELALDARVQLHVTSSVRRPDQDVQGAIVEPARASNHLVGHAIDMNIVVDGRYYNSRLLRDPDRLPARARTFIDGLRGSPNLRWGGDFSMPDPVHIDDSLNHSDPERWGRLYAGLWGDPGTRLA